MLRFIYMICFGSALLFGYEKGDVLDQQIVDKLHLQQEKIYIIDFFASWCHSCKKEMPSMAKLYNSIDKNKVEIIGIDVDEDIESAHRFQEELKHQNMLQFNVIDDPKGEIVSVFNPIGTPALYVVKNNQIIAVEFGAKNNIDTIVLQHIQKAQQ